MEYIAVVRREGKHLLVKFPDALGCQTFVAVGENAYPAAKEALEVWLESQLAHGEAPSRPSSPRQLRAHVPKRAGSFRGPVRVAPSLAARILVRWAREDRRWSQSELARQVGVSQQAIAKLESPDSNLTFSTLEKVAAALGLEVQLELAEPRQLVAAGR